MTEPSSPEPMQSLSRIALLLSSAIALGACAAYQPYSDDPAPDEYIVQPGDNVHLIAFALETTPEALGRANPWANPRQLAPGTRLTVPRPESVDPLAGGGREITGVDIQPRAADFIWPLRKYRVTSRFGRRWGRLHAGIDLRAPKGTPVRAAADGRVIFSGFRGAYGHKIIISHGRGVETVYAHNSRNLVKRGQRVKQGEIIANVGRSGNATGYHVHFEFRRHGQALDPVRQIQASL